MDHANLHFKSNVNGIININGTFGDYIDNENKFSLYGTFNCALFSNAISQ